MKKEKNNAKNKPRNADQFIPEPISGHYDEQVSKIWAKQLPDLPFEAIPLLALMDVLSNLTSRFHHRALKHFGVSHIEYSIMSTILLNGQGVKPSVITNIVGKGTSGTSQALRKLEKNGYITRDKSPEDKRSVTVNLTGEGLKLAKELCESEALLSSKLFQEVDADEVFRLRQGISAVLEKFV